MIDITKISETIREINEREFPKGTPTISVSNVITQLHEEFDKDGQAQRCFEKYFNDPNSKYYQMSAEDIKQSWEDKANASKKYGRLSDKYIEFRMNGHSPEERNEFLISNNIENENEDFPFIGKPLKRAFDGFDEFYDKMQHGFESFRYEFIERELTLYYRFSDVIVKGRFDALFSFMSNNHPQSLVLVDWKTNGEIEKNSNYGKKMYGPCYKLDDCNYNHYCMQLEIYKQALINTYHVCNKEEINTFIVQLGKEAFEHNYFMHPCINMEDYVNNAILFAYNKINSEE